MSPTKRPSTINGLRRGVGATAVPAPSAETEPVPAGETSTPRRPRPEKPVRFTLDLDRDHHQFLKQFAVQAEARGAAEVMRALLDELREDPSLADRIRARVWEGKR